MVTVQGVIRYFKARFSEDCYSERLKGQRAVGMCTVKPLTAQPIVGPATRNSTINRLQN